MFSQKDLEQMRARGISRETVLSQIKIFRKGILFSRLLRPCRVDDGIVVLQETDIKRLSHGYSKIAATGRTMKFVPASGAATRMFKSFQTVYHRYGKTNVDKENRESGENDTDYRMVRDAMEGLRRFAFFDDLRFKMAKDGLDMEVLLSQGDFEPILEYILTPKGLEMADLPKGLILFHRYPDHNRTPFEEHIKEAENYTRDRYGVIRLHFTVPGSHLEMIRDHIETATEFFQQPGFTYQITLSTQKPSTDTIAVDMENQPFRDVNGRLEFRPGGHGALLENLQELEGDIVFIKNIDNVVPDRLKSMTYTYKMALGGYLSELQVQIFRYLIRFYQNDTPQKFLDEAFDFIRQRLFIAPPNDILRRPKREKVEFLISKLNRPLRVCGMVKNEGEPGGGPFWVVHPDGTPSMQIVESAQVDMASSKQRAIWESSTHFNPVDLVCGVRDFSGHPFDLKRYRDPDAGFISIKSKEGRDLKALELPGLWNGAMAFWNTVFVEVPIMTFNPVKTILDLLRKEHQP
ncbi:MAG: DUF4301 family protein [Deltaproteobacteria bacterium]|nr:DUF4301 family protein [Deltaproteobacteria bacterium]